MKKIIVTILILLLSAIAAAQKIPHGVTLTWTWSGTGTPTYNVYRTTTSGGEAKPALAIGLTSATYVDASAAVNTQYYYTVTTTVGGVESAPSVEVGALIAVPPAPQNPAASIF